MWIKQWTTPPKSPLKRGCLLFHKWTKWRRVRNDVGTPYLGDQREKSCLKCGKRIIQIYV